MNMDIPPLPAAIGAALNGGYFAGLYLLYGEVYGLVVAPREGEIEMPWHDSLAMIEGARSYVDGFANTQAMAAAGSKMAKWARGLAVNGADDWYLPSRDELELVYRSFKPTTDTNNPYGRHGENQCALPPTYAYTEDSPAQGHTVVSWQGVRRDESEARKDALKFEPLGGRMFIYRPIVDWTKKQAFEYCAARGRHPNPLYSEGCDRVGCAPCINSKKDEIRQTNLRRRHHLVRISEWERIVSLASKRGYSTFFHKVDNQGGLRASAIYSRNEVWQVVEWAQTSRGGRQFSLLNQLDDPAGCSSSYGLCDQGTP
ncbi:phosphoadenosine phosphosulfate reductase domain-containing protein [Massilia endophytica]|uniref:phosphoadenosine phosphosulfate reductase domain-containing protein n=1 Tax=Massilia endophytica TaxID=2899220 RepID=UPI001E38AAC6|nr:phosphoadenosine phosphosulfate reductase family protein [Massilia endophytica]UGQ45106.1 phosphoadenosine phosphosulfate reductase family protein [Massilia endophytica]